MLQVGVPRLWVPSGSSLGCSSRSLQCKFSCKLAVEQVPAAAAAVKSSSSRSPWLMLPSGFVKDDSNGDNYNLFSVAEKKVRSLKKNLEIPWRRHHFGPEGNTVCTGSSLYGWLSMFNKRNGKLFLFNPFGNPLEFSQTYIPLPPLESVRDCISSFYRQDVISTTSNTQFVDKDCKYHLVDSNPTTPKKISKETFVKLAMSVPPLTNSLTWNEDCVVMARMQLGSSYRSFVCCRPGDTTWTSLHFDEEYYGEPRDFTFTYFSKDKLFYTFSEEGKLISWDLLRRPNSFQRRNSTNMQTLVYNLLPPKTQPTMSQEQLKLRYDRMDYHYYLVDSFGDLLLVVRSTNPKDVLDDCSDKKKKKEKKWTPKEWMEATFGFDVYKFDFVNKKWVYVPDLGDDRVLFLGLNSFSISLSDNPELKGSISGNSIYFSFGRGQSGSRVKNNDYRYHDCGVYNLKDASITTFLPESFSFPKNKISKSPFIWIHPQH